MTGMTETGTGWDEGMLSGSPRGRDGTSGHWAPPDSSCGVAVFVRRAVCTVFSLRSTTKVSGSGAHTAPEGASRHKGWSGEWPRWLTGRGSLLRNLRSESGARGVRVSVCVVNSVQERCRCCSHHSACGARLCIW